MRQTSEQSLSTQGNTLIPGVGVCTSNFVFDGHTELDVARSLASAPYFLQLGIEGGTLAHESQREMTWRQSYLPVLGHGLVEQRTRFELLKDSEKARVVIKAYEPVAHFRRHLSIPVSQLTP